LLLFGMATALTPEQQKQLDDQLVQATINADMVAVHEFILKGADYQASFRKSIEFKQQIATPALNMNMFQKPSDADGAPAAVELSAVKVDVPANKPVEKAPLTAHAEESKVTSRSLSLLSICTNSPLRIAPSHSKIFMSVYLALFLTLNHICRLVFCRSPSA
jgi:hypothetical protein